MSKKKSVDSRLTMHKLLGDHSMVNAALCKECGIREGEKIIEEYEPITLGQKNVEDLVNAIMSLADRVRNLETQLTMTLRNINYPPAGAYGGAGGTGGAVGIGGAGGGISDYYTWKLGTNESTTKIVPMTYSSNTKVIKNESNNKELMSKILEKRAYGNPTKEAWDKLKENK